MELDYLEDFIKTASRLDKARHYDHHIQTLINICREQQKLIDTYNISQNELERSQNIITAAEKISEVLEKHGLYITPCVC